MDFLYKKMIRLYICTILLFTFYFNNNCIKERKENIKNNKRIGGNEENILDSLLYELIKINFYSLQESILL